MAGLIPGKKQSAYLGFETTFGTKASSLIAYPISTLGGGIKVDYINADTKVGKRVMTGNYIGSKLGEAEIETIAYDKASGYLFKAVLGSVSSSLVGASAAYEHTFTYADTLPSLTLQNKLSDVKAYDYLGVVLDELTVKASVKDFIKLNGKFIFQDEVEEASPETSTWSEENPFLTKQIQLKIDDTAFAEATDFELTIKNNVKNDDYRLNQSDKVASLDPQGLDISGKITVVFNATSVGLRDKFLNGTKMKLELIATGSEIESGYNRSLTITLPEVQVTDGQIDASGDAMTMEIPFTAFLPDSGEIITIKLVNEETSY